ncbi:MAG TPA: SDR family NAD(P)-dependent oxidoreductase [Candidatus Saccharimonadales bacterium]|nr:SDR family NAD(P)-dependent oxidoreductase [Candidatus Saccharimonadales bacterium]
MKTVVITGANHGLGLATARQFLQAGWRVAALARTPPELPASDNLRVELADLTDMAAMVGVVDRLKGVPVDVLINNAGVFDADNTDAPAASKNFDRLTNVFQVNAIIPRILADALLSNLQAGEDKLVVTISSGMGTFKGLNEYNAEHWAYSASKAATNHAMISFAKLHPDIKSTLVHPGWVQTSMGGSGALIPVDEAALYLYKLIVEHARKLPNAKLVDYEGKGMDL